MNKNSVQAKNKGSLFLIISLILVQSSITPVVHASVIPLMNVSPRETSGEEQSGFAASGCEIDLSGGLKIQDLGNLYVITNPYDSSFLEVIERLPSGGFGRILRYRGWFHEGRWIDLEFIYQDKEDSVTVLDYQKGRFFRTTLTQRPPNPSSLAPSLEANHFMAGWAVVSPTLKSPLGKENELFLISPQRERLHSQFEALLGDEVWMNRKVRGPPAGEATL